MMSPAPVIPCLLVRTTKPALQGSVVSTAPTMRPPWSNSMLASLPCVHTMRNDFILADEGHSMEVKPVESSHVWRDNCNQQFGDNKKISFQNHKCMNCNHSSSFFTKGSLGYLSSLYLEDNMYLGRKEIADSSLLVRLLTFHLHDLCGDFKRFV